MNFLPKEIEDMIMGYKEQLEQSELVDTVMEPVLELYDKNKKKFIGSTEKRPVMRQIKEYIKYKSNKINEPRFRKLYNFCNHYKNQDCLCWCNPDYDYRNKKENKDRFIDYLFHTKYDCCPICECRYKKFKTNYNNELNNRKKEINDYLIKNEYNMKLQIKNELSNKKYLDILKKYNSDTIFNDYIDDFKKLFIMRNELYLFKEYINNTYYTIINIYGKGNDYIEVVNIEKNKKDFNNKFNSGEEYYYYKLTKDIEKSTNYFVKQYLSI